MSASRETESATERFERVAEEFYRETGIIAPGKDVPPGMGQPPYGMRWAAFMNWQEERRRVSSAPAGRTPE